VLILGGPRFATVEVEIYYQATALFNLPTAAVLSLLQIGVMLGMLVFYTRLQRGIASDMQRTQVVARRARTTAQKALVAINVVVIVVVLFAPLLALVIRSFTGEQGVTIASYRLLSENPRNSVLFVPPFSAVANSIQFALLTTLLAVSMGLITAQLLVARKWRLASLLDPLFMLPLATSAVTLGFGYIIALDQPPLNLRTSPWLVVFAHTLVAMPFVVRSVLPAMRAIAPGIQEAARVLGASPWQVWRLIDLPLMSRGLLVGATFAFTVSMGEFGASLFIYRPEMPTIPIVIYRLLGQPGAQNYGQALAMSVVLMAVSAVGFLLIERLRTAGIGEF
jgi:thiamine transport system permease protein